jgi:hypothetical protein
VPCRCKTVKRGRSAARSSRSKNPRTLGALLHAFAGRGSKFVTHSINSVIKFLPPPAAGTMRGQGAGDLLEACRRARSSSGSSGTDNRTSGAKRPCERWMHACMMHGGVMDYWDWEEARWRGKKSFGRVRLAASRHCCSCLDCCSCNP